MVMGLANQIYKWRANQVEGLTLPSGLLFILSRTLSKAGFPVVSPKAAIRSALRGSNNAPTAEPTATAACCHPFNLKPLPRIMTTQFWKTKNKENESGNKKLKSKSLLSSKQLHKLQNPPTYINIIHQMINKNWFTHFHKQLVGNNEIANLKSN